jgi:uncharacterized protein YyaL (SSP411 family)
MLAEVILERFLDRENGGFFFTSEDHERLIARTKPAFDGSTPSGNSAAAIALLRLFEYTGEERFRAAAERTLRLFREQIEQQPFSFAHMLEGVDLYQRGPTEVVIAGEPDSPDYRHWIERLGLSYVPNLALFATGALDGGVALPEQVRGKHAINGRVTAYVCRERVCSAPIVEFKELEAELS